MLRLWPFIGSKASFLKPYEGEEGMATMYQQALSFWNKLDSVSPIFVIIFLAVGILMAYLYYGPYNEQAHRHYLVKHWAKFLIVCAVISLIATFAVVSYMAVPPRMNGTLSMEILLAINNAVYAAVVFLATSFVWCNWLPTNAYRLLKFNRKK